jgi:hypothetical protein
LPINHSRFARATGAAIFALALGASVFAGPFAQEQKKCDVPSTNSEDPSMTQKSKFYCNLKVLTPAERARHKQLSGQLAAARIEVKELPDGFAFRLQREAVSLIDLAEWVSAETKCCPFFDFEIQVERDNGSLWLKLCGEEGVKQFIVSDFHVR